AAAAAARPAGRCVRVRDGRHLPPPARADRARAGARAPRRAAVADRLGEELGRGAEPRGGRRMRVVVVGGGLAGIAAALELADGGADVQLLEARPRLGGATFSIERDGISIDNGQHVFLRCCTAYIALLERLGVSD